MAKDHDVAKALLLLASETAIMIVVFKLLSKPDALTLLKMKTFRGLENGCQRNAEFWAHMAALSHDMYDASRSTV